MISSHTTADFWKCFKHLPPSAKLQATLYYKKWYRDPFCQSLQFKRIGKKNAIYSVRVGLRWRALGLMDDEEIIWFWIGSHEDYNNIIKRL